MLLCSAANSSVLVQCRRLKWRPSKHNSNKLAPYLVLFYIHHSENTTRTSVASCVVALSSRLYVAIVIEHVSQSIVVGIIREREKERVSLACCAVQYL